MDGYVIKLDELIDDDKELLNGMTDLLRELLMLKVEKESSGASEERDESKGVKCKWAHLGLYTVLSSLVKLQHDNTTEVMDEVQDCLNALTEIDPCRSECWRVRWPGTNMECCVGFIFRWIFVMIELNAQQPYILFSKE
jgi:hypothetical protein